MPHIVFDRVSKRYGKHVALNELSLSIEKGEFISLLGPSGSGKSTTLNLLAGLADIDAGEIHIEGKLINGLPPDRREIAMVFQNYALYPHLSIYDNLAFPLRVRKRAFPKDQIEPTVNRIAEALGIGALLQRFPKEISGGQQQRVALGRAMIRDPSVFLLDEPLSNLDSRLRLKMRKDIKALHNRVGSTIVYVTHDQAEAMAMSSRIAVFSNGELQQFASPGDIYNSPANTFVAGFVGDREINLFRGTFVNEAERLSLRVGSHTIAVDSGFVKHAADVGDEVLVGFRCESIDVMMEPGTDRLPAIAALTELVGPDLFVQAEADSLTLECRASPQAAIATGDRIYLKPRWNEMHLFDVATGRNLRSGRPS